MLTRNKSESGVAHPLMLLLLLVVVAVVGFAAYRVEQNNNKPLSTATNTTYNTAQSPQTIKTPADLTSAEAALNQTNLDSDLNPNSFNADVSSLL